ncbi:MAG: hypothetical protein J1F64_07260, partial [Oscillospiraceae bacterium]|nr:hypothetical protein [Oscillospiraceae bacterium]
MKKFILTICFAVSIFAVFSLSAAAEGECRIFVEDASAAGLSTVAVSLKIENNPGMALGNVRIYFDNEKLTPVSINKGNILADSEYFTSNLEDPSVDENELDYISISWMKTSNMNGDGELAEIEFAALENTNTDINVEIIELANAVQNNLTAAVGGGKITFEGISGEDDNNNDIIVGITSNSLKRGNNSVSGDINLSVYSPEEITATAICSIFDGNGKLSAVKILDTSLKSGVNDIALTNLNADIPASDVCYAKVYI